MSDSRMPPELLAPPFAAAGDLRLSSPAFPNNGLPILGALTPRLAEAAGEVLEVGSGPGQHTALLARSFPQLVFQPSDPDPAHRASIDAWAASLELANLRPAIELDAAAQDWPMETGPAARRFCAVLSINVVHIAPWAVAEGLFRGAAGRLSPEGFLALYGPFRWHGRHISQSNAAFDARLRESDPAWGVRDVDDIDRLAASHRLQRVEAVNMPANNHMLFFTRDPR